MGAKLSFRYRSVNIGIATYSKQVKVAYWSKKISTCDIFLLGSTENTGGWDNSFSVIGANAFRTTHYQI